LFPSADGAKVLLRDGEYGVAAGQACVFYADCGHEARVLGGGWIARALSRTEQPARLDAAKEASAAAERDVSAEMDG
jgi:tRNA-specific 2-thiouridylase